MPEAQTRQQELTSQLNDAQEKERLKNVEPKLQEAVKVANSVDLRNKTQFMLYPETRTLMILKAIAEADDTSVQEFVRNAIDAAIDRRMKPPRTRRKRTATKKGA